MAKHRRGTEFDKQIGSRLRQLRLNRDLSQTELGNGIGVSFQQIQKYEKGINAIASSRMPKLCEILKISPNELYRTDEQTKTMSAIKISTLRIAKRLDRLLSPQRNVVSAIIEEFEKENGQ